jgi:hypothetical protein
MKVRCFFAVFAVLTTAEHDNSDFMEEHLKTDEPAFATEAHPDIDLAWILPECPDGKVPIGSSSDMLAALNNVGSKMFNVTHIEGKFFDAAGSVIFKLARYDYGQPLGPHEQRSFRYPLVLPNDAPLGEYTLTARAYYASRDREKFVSVVYNETTTLVAPLPSSQSEQLILQVGLLSTSVIVLGMLVRQSLTRRAGKYGKKPAAGYGNHPTSSTNDWLNGTLVSNESRSIKKRKA